MGAITQTCCLQSKTQCQKQNGSRQRAATNPSQRSQAQKEKLISVDDLSSTNFSTDSSRIKQNIATVDDCQSSDSYNNKTIFNRKVNIRDFEILGKLGSGTFGTVYLAQLKAHLKALKHEKLAMKCISLSELTSQRLKCSIKFQKNVLQNLDHPFLTSLRFAFRDARYAYLVMECGTGGAADTFINLPSIKSHKRNHRAMKFTSLGEEGLRFIAANVVLGMEQLHRHNIMYRDLKPENVILFQDGYAKLTDFGLSKVLSANELTNTEAGTLTYFAPELIAREYYTKAIDFWTLGVFLYELATFESPFKEHQLLVRKKFKQVVINAETGRDWKNFELSQELKDLINKLLRYDPSRRLGANGFHEIREHPFFSKIDWQKMYNKQLPSPLLPIIKAHPIRIRQVGHNSAPTSLDAQFLEEQDDWDYNSLTPAEK